ncbi:uncharacterized protein EI90DRAFT_3152277 [Cantharellus anzutake]|uniref:uncharacterized protein n=1 Tax=Cantharellus anzutake TaxID=1750568 RepID=UPI001904040B|nr:uncharacterized protein EI90DRAFT_3152277 [Cantharellus anzutake]KAF8337652.1 hypothetical protein EI90DRAFT_3152277 [Cantharellus anzutake]
MAPFILKFKGNKSFSPFSQLSDTDSLTRTWKVCTKVAAHLEQGQRLENLSWRCWFLHSLMVEADNTKSKREFKKMTKSMGEKLDKEKGRSIEELHAPDFKGSDSTSRVKQRADERFRDTHMPDGSRPSMKGMQYTFSVAPPTIVTTNVTKPSVKKSTTPSSGPPSGSEHPRQDTNAAVRPLQLLDENCKVPQFSPAEIHLPPSPTDMDRPPSQTDPPLVASQRSNFSSVVRFPALFSSDFSPTALLGPSSASTNPRMSYGEDVIGAGLTESMARGSFDVPRPAFEFPLDELMDSPESRSLPNGEEEMKDAFSHPAGNSVTHQDYGLSYLFSSSGNDVEPYLPKSDPTQVLTLQYQANTEQFPFSPYGQLHHPPMTISPTSPDFSAPFPGNVVQAPPTNTFSASVKGRPRSSSKHQRDEDAFVLTSTPSRGTRHSHSASLPHFSSQTLDVLPSPSSSSVTPSRRNSLKNGNRHQPPSATPPPRAQRSSHGGLTPSSVKTECANCGATSTPLWRRGLNDELNCNACGLFAKLHKRARPKTLRNQMSSENNNRQGVWTPRQSDQGDGEAVSCYNCHTTATPLWRKDEGGRTLCNACGLYLKLHGERRPSSMKSDVVRKRNGRKGSSPSDTPTGTPNESTHTSPIIGPSMPPTIQDIHPPMLPSSFDFSAAGFEFSQVTHDSTDRLTYQHELDRDATLRMTMSPGSSYLENLTYPAALSAYNVQPFYNNSAHDTTSDDTAGSHGNGRAPESINLSPGAATVSTGRAAFQDDGFKRRRVSPEVDAHVSTEVENAFGTVDDQVSRPFDHFSAYYPYPFTFTSAASLFHPPMAFVPEDQIEAGEAMDTSVSCARGLDKDGGSPNSGS